MEKIKIDGGYILFDEAKHRFYHQDMSPIKSVTTFTGIIDKSGPLIGWAIKLAREYALDGVRKIFRSNTTKLSDIESLILEACKQHTIKKEKAADHGTNIHGWIEQKIAGENPPIPVDPSERNGVLAFLKFQDEHKVKWIESEKRIYSKVNDYAGILDAVGKIGKDLVLIDFKSSNGLYPEFAFQAAAYQIAYEEMTGKKIDYRMIIGFGKETGEFQIKEYRDNVKDKKAFLACLVIKRRLEELK